MKFKLLTRFIPLLIIFVLFFSPLYSSTNDEKTEGKIDKILSKLDSLQHRLDILEKISDDILWYNKVGDIAYIDKVRHTGPPPANVQNPTAMGANNPVKFYSYIFIPRAIEKGRKYPLLIFPHGGVHGNFSTYYTHIIRELVTQKYIIVAPEYRGSTGYGKNIYELIDYGGREVDDVNKSRQYMLDNYSFIDKDRVGILGWSHGGLITLMNIFNYPKNYKVAYAGVPVSDLIARMGYMTDSYRGLYSAKYHIGKTANQDVNEYRRRSPAWNAEKLKTPLLIHTNTSDEDVNVLEVEHLIKSLKAAGKKFEYKIFQNLPGGHSFDRLDLLMSKKIRLKIYKFLAAELKPPVILKNINDLNQASYSGYKKQSLK